MVRLWLCFGLGFALHFQPVFFQLLRVERLLGAVVLRRVLGPPLATIRAIAPVAATTAATAAAIAPPAAWLFAIRTRCAVADFRTGILVLLHGRPRLLRRTRGTLVRPALALRLLRLAFRLREFALLLLDFALRPLLLWLLGLRRALIPARLLFAAWLLVRTAAAAIALLFLPAVAASVAATTATASSAPITASAAATVSAATLMPVAMLVARAFRTLRSVRAHRSLVRRGRLVGRLLGA